MGRHAKEEPANEAKARAIVEAVLAHIGQAKIRVRRHGGRNA